MDKDEGDTKSGAVTPWFLFAALAAIILPTGVTHQDETLDLLLALLFTLILAGLLWRVPARGASLLLPFFAIPWFILAAYLLVLAAFGVSGYQPHAPVIRLLLGGSLFVLSYNLFKDVRPVALLGALRALVLLIALAYLPLTQWDWLPGEAETRYRFTFWHANALGCFLAMGFPFLLAHQALPDQSRNSRVAGVLAITAAIFLAGAVESRMAVILMVAEAVVLLPMIARYRRGISLRKALPLTLAAVAGITLLLAAVFGKDWMTSKFSRLLHGQESGRKFMWHSVMDMITDSPGTGLAGHGAGILYQESWNFSLGDHGFFGRGKADAFAHNQALDWTLEGGLVGLAAFAAFALLLVVPILRAARAAGPGEPAILRVALVLSALAILLFAQVSIASQFAIVIALEAVLLAGMMAMLGITPRSVSLPRPTLLALGVCAATALVVQFPKVLSDYHLAKATRLLEGGDESPDADRLLAKSIRWDEGNAHAWYLQLVNSHHKGDRKGVEEAYQAIESRIPNLLATRLVYAANLAGHGKLAEALPVLDGYLEVNTYDFNSHCQFILYATYLKKPDEVTRGVERLVQTHVSAVTAKGGEAPQFEVTADEKGIPLWRMRWPDRDPITLPLPVAKRMLFKGLNRNPAHDYPAIIANAHKLIAALGFEPGTLEKGKLGGQQD